MSTNKKICKSIFGSLLTILLLFIVCNAVYQYKREHSFYIKTDFYETKDNSNYTLNIKEERIIYVSHYTNFAWGYDNAGYFIDSKAQLYFFQIDDYLTTDTLEDINDLIPYLEIVKKNTKPSAKINMKYVKEICELTSKINTNAQYSTISVACDAGSRDAFCYNSATDSFIKCFCTGDETKVLEDTYAHKIKKIYDDVIAVSINSAPKYVTRTSVYPLNGIHFENIICDKGDLKGNYIALTKKELLEFGSKNGCDVSSILLDCEKKDFMEYMYFIKFHNSTHSYSENDMSMLLWNGSKIDFILDSATSTTKELTSNTSQCFIAAVPAIYNVDILSDIKDTEKTSWQRINTLDINKCKDVYRDTTIITNSKEYDEFIEEFDKGYVIIDSEGMYHTFLSRLGIHNLKTKEYDVLNDFFEKKAVPNFDEGVLFIKFNSLSNTEKLEINDMLLLDKSLYTGVETVETYRFSLFSNYKGVITYVYIPNKYLNKDQTYVVR